MRLLTSAEAADRYLCYAFCEESQVTHARAASVVSCILIGAIGLAGCTGRGAGAPTAAPSSNAPTSYAPTSSGSPAQTRVYSFGVVGSSGKLLQLDHSRPTLVSGITGTVIQIATSNSDSYALTSTGALWAWGAGANGELGDGTNVEFVRTAVRVDFPAGVKISSLPNPMPYDAGLAIDSRGDIWGWGSNEAHELCLSSAQALLRPTRLPLTDVTLATGAGGHTLFDSKGKVYACGDGADGELGDGSTSRSSAPAAVVGLPNGRVKSLVSSWQGSGALMDNGSYYDWGLNRQGQLGDGNSDNSSVPVRVHLPAAVTQVSQGGSLEKNGQTLAILSDASVWAWGNGRWGQLGNGGSANSKAPVRIKLPTGVSFVEVSAGGYSCYAIDKAGILWARGRNEFGQLGNGASAQVELVPVSVRVGLTQVSSTATNVAGFLSR